MFSTVTICCCQTSKRSQVLLFVVRREVYVFNRCYLLFTDKQMVSSVAICSLHMIK